MHLDRTWIEAHIPHQGRMCLLDEVLEWDSRRISCRSGTHRALDHPLRAEARLGSACGVEYAAQAMAVHGALSAGALHAADVIRKPAAGFLASLRSVRFYVLRLDDVAGDLYCDATRTAGDADTALYEFALHCAAGPLLSGRATVVLDAAGRLKMGQV